MVPIWLLLKTTFVQVMLHLAVQRGVVSFSQGCECAHGLGFHAASLIHKFVPAPHQHELDVALSVRRLTKSFAVLTSVRCRLSQVTGFDIPHRFPEDYVPVFGMDPTTTVAYYNDRFTLCVLLPLCGRTHLDDFVRPPSVSCDDDSATWRWHRACYASADNRL